MGQRGGLTSEASNEIASELVIRSDHEGIATLTLNRPQKLNALNPGMFVALRRHLDDLEGSDSVGCVVLCGAGRGFCAGHDLDSIAAKERAPNKYYEAEVIDQLAELAIPTIAQVHGVCLTGGLELALACDLIVAASSARFGDTHSKWGLVPVWGMSVRLPERVGVAQAKQLMFTSDVVDAETAVSIGLAVQCVSEHKLEGSVKALADQIVNTSAGTNTIVKRLMADRTKFDPVERLQRERTRHHGVPADTRERFRAGGR